jgi:predicted ferric reductase
MSSNRKLYGYSFFTVLTGMPVVLWLAGSGVSAAIGSSSAFVASLGKASALVGLAAYSLMPVLSMRHHILERTFGGLDVLYRLHAQSGKVSFFFIVAHPVFLAAGGLLGGAGILTVWNWTSPMIIAGIFALECLIVLTALTIYAHIRHQQWIAIHRLFGWLLPILFIHALLARGQIVQNRALFVYMAVLGSLGFMAFLYRSVGGHFFVKRYRYAVAEVNKLTPTITELVLKPLGIPINYTPGQFAYVSMDSSVVDNEAHPYSFTTANNGPYVRFTIKELGDDTAHVKQLNPGTKAYLEGPYGNFSLHNTKRMNQVWIAGGVGITPFLSMARSLSRRSKYKIKLFYAADNLEDAVFLKELLAIRQDIPDKFDITIVDKELSGFVDIETLRNEIAELGDNDYFICGPPQMMRALKKQLTEHGVDAGRIFSEEFSMR